MFARIAFAVPVGAVVTAGLLIMMHMFVETGPIEVAGVQNRITFKHDA